MYKVCFIGVGSIAKRHIQNLREIFNIRKEELKIDVCRSGKGNKLDEGVERQIDQCFFSLEELPDEYDIIFITNPTEYHIQTLEKVNEKGKNFFIEKPLTSINQLEKFKDFCEDFGKIYYVACPLRYTKVIQYIADHVNSEQVSCIRCISSSYLPEWRPGQDYRETYSAKKNLGGGAAIDLIHEWDYIKFLFGRPKDVKKIVNKISNLEIDSDDIAVYIAAYENRIAELHLDYFGRASIRRMQIFTAEDTIECDLLENKIHYLKAGRSIEFQQSRNEYQMSELQNFIDMIEGKTKNQNTLKDAYDTLLLTQGVIE